MKRSALTAAATVVAILLAGPAYAGPPDPTPPPPGPLDVAMSIHGSACKPTTMSWHMQPDNSELLVNYDEFIAQAGPRIPVTEQRKNCSLVAQVDVPAGYTFSITGATYYGFAILEGTASARLDTRYYFGPATPVPPAVQHPIGGPPNGFTWELTDTAVATPATCDAARALNLFTDLRVIRGDSRHDIAAGFDHNKEKFSAVYTLEWHRC